MKLFLIILLTLSAPFTSAAGSIEPEQALPAYSKTYDPGRDPFTDGRHALEYAKLSKRQVLIELGGNWCTYCRKLDHFIAATPAVKALLHEKFVLLKVNVSDENDNREFRNGLPQTFGFPHFFVADKDGNILYSKDTAQLLEHGQYSPRRFIEFLQKWGAAKGGAP